MKYLLVVFAAMVLSLLWLGERYKHKAKELETAKTAPAATPAAASVKPVQPAAKTPPAAATDQVGKPAATVAPVTPAPVAEATGKTTAPLPATGTAAAAPAGTAPATTTAPATDPAKPPAPPKDWQQICYNASMQAEHAMRRHMDGALAAEVTNMGNQTDPEYRDNLQGIMNQVNTTPITSDFGQQQLEMDNIKSSTYNNCMAGHR